MADLPCRVWQHTYPEMFDETANTISQHTKAVAQFIEETTFEVLPAAVVHDTKRLVLDTVACAITGCDVASSRISREVALSLGGVPDATVIAKSDKTSPPMAALANAKAANAIDMDDTFMNIAHFAPQAVMAPLALGEALHRSGREYLLAVSVGYEVAARIALSANFWRVTSGLVLGTGSQWLVFGANVFAAAAGAGKILGMDAERQAAAMGVCAHFAPVRARSTAAPVEPPFCCDSGYMAKYCDGGWAAMTGVMSALYAQAGFVINHHALDGRHGYIKMLGGEAANPAILSRDLSANQSHWYISDSALKSHPFGKYVHNPLYLFLDILQENTIAPDEIERVVVHLRPAHAIGFANQEVEIEQGIPCSHNIPYNLALAAFGVVKPTAQWHAGSHGENPEIRALMRKIFTQPSGEAAMVGVEDIKECGYPKEMFSQVDVYCRGKMFSRRSLRSKGDPWWPETRFTDEDLAAKLERCAEGAFDNRQTQEIIQTVMHLEELDDLSTFAALLKI